MDKRIKPVLWSFGATRDLEKITRFYVKFYGPSKARKIATELRKSTDTFKTGAIDKSFTHLKQNYRKLINHHCNITYREEKTTFYIVRIFDTRQHPNKNK